MKKDLDVTILMLVLVYPSVGYVSVLVSMEYGVAKFHFHPEPVSSSMQ